MSKQGKRKITVDLSKSKETNNRPSVFERLGTKKSSGAKKTTEHCRQWAQHGTCPYGKSCKFALTHVLISPSKQRAANKDSDKKHKDDPKSRFHSSVVVRVGRSPEGDAEEDNWDQNDLEYADTDVLEKRRQQLQRELELQLKMDSNKDMRKDKKKAPNSSSSSRSSSSSSVSSTSSDNSSSSSSSGRHPRRKGKKTKLKRNSSSSSDDMPSKKKNLKTDSIKKNDAQKLSNVKKGEKPTKKLEPKKKVLSKPIRKKSLSPGKKAGGTPPITSKSVNKGTKQGKSPIRKEKISSISPVAARDREKDRKEREKEKDRVISDRVTDRDKDRSKVRSKSPRKARSRSPRRNRSPSKDLRRKESVERGRPISPKKPIRRDASSDKHRKHSPSRDKDRSRENKDKSTERRKDKSHDDKERHDRKDTRSRDRNKEVKRDDVKRRGRERGLGRGAAANKGLEKPSKPMERLLPRPEERLAALAAISNRAMDLEKNSSNPKDRQDDRSGRKQERDRSGKRMESLDRDQSDYDVALDRKYDRGGSMDRYERSDDRYEDKPRDGDRSPGYLPGRERHYDSNYDMPGPSRNYPEDDRMYGDHISERRGDISKEYEDRRHRERSWEGRPGSLDRERGYSHGPHGKEWPQDDYRPPGDWGRERHWPVHEPPMNDWVDKEPEPEGWHHRGHPAGPHRGRGHGDFNRGMRVDHMNKRRPQQRTESEPVPKEAPPPAPAHAAVPPPKLELEDEKAIPDDLSEISDDPDDILNRDDMIEHTVDEESQAAPVNEPAPKPDSSENHSTQDTNGPLDEKDAIDPKEEDESNLDFEEISDGELEEERARAGVGDALGVDWASLVLDVRRREQASDGGGGGARDRWRPERALTRAGLSFQLAGTDLVRAIVEKNAESFVREAKCNEVEVNGEADVEDKSNFEAPTMDALHPVAALQVAIARRVRQRGALFGSDCEIRRAVCARRDLALRRHLCRLPPTDRAPPKHHAASSAAPHHQLFHQARAMLMKT